MDEKATAQSDSKFILSTYADVSKSAGRIRYFIVDDYCSIHGKHHGWDKLRIHFASLQVTQDLIAMEDGGILSDTDDYLEDHEETLKKTTSKNHMTKREKLGQKDNKSGSKKSENTSVTRKLRYILL